MTETSRELALYAINNADLYHQRTVPICRNLALKRRKGTYDADKAVTGMMYAADDAARMYVREFCAAGEKWHEIFPKPDRIEAAREMLEHYDSYISELANGVVA